MPRITAIDPDQLDAEQRLVLEETVAGKRGRVPAPMNAWIKSPEYARRVQKLGEFLRYDTTLPPTLSELAILLVARHWTSHYEWYAHKREGLKGGMDPEVIRAIAERSEPDFTTSKERAVYDVSKSLLEHRVVPDALYRTGVAELGEVGMVELMGLLGFYTLVSMTLNTFEIGLPEGVEPELV